MDNELFRILRSEDAAVLVGISVSIVSLFICIYALSYLRRINRHDTKASEKFARMSEAWMKDAREEYYQDQKRRGTARR